MAWNRRQFLLGIPAGVGALWAARSSRLAFLNTLFQHAPIKVLVGHNAELHAQLLSQALELDRSLHAVGATASSREFFEVAARHTPEIAVLFDDDMHIGLSALKEFCAAYPRIPVIFVWSGWPRPITLEALPWGAREVLGSHESLKDLIECIHAIHEGCPLTWRERKIVPLLCQGLTYHEIAVRLRLSTITVRNYRYRIFEKLGVSNRIELAQLVRSNPKYRGLLNPQTT